MERDAEPAGGDGGALAWPDRDLAEASARIEGDGYAVLGRHLVAGTDPVAAVRSLLVEAVGGLFPAWLPQAEGIDKSAGAGEAAVRALAREAAAGSPLFGPFLEEMAAASLRHRRAAMVTGFALQTVVRECTRLIAISYGGRPVALVLKLPDEGIRAGERDLEWLADVAGLSLRLVGPGAARLSRIRIVRTAAPAAEPPAAAETYITPLSGRPCPLSEAETRLEAFLASCPWAAGRRWSQTVPAGPLEPETRVDLLWERRGLIVEIDGSEHRARDKFADDRRRDRRLHRLGFRVVRFTNEEVLEDVQRVASEIEGFVRMRQVNDGDG